MHFWYSLLLFMVTLLGGSVPLWIKWFDDRRMHYLLAFSGSFLLSITFLHLLPETFEDLNVKAGFYLLVGFFAQLLIQRFTHGVEHGHAHIHPHEHHVALTSILAGLTLHAFMEGLPLGFNYHMHGTEPSLYMAVAVHKVPEAMLVTSLVLSVKNRRTALLILMCFAAVTPLAGMAAEVLGERYYFMSHAVLILIPVVAGAFIHIATTIFFESGTKQHLLTWQKIAAMITGVGMAMLTLCFE
ncbi:ZIP family metal transporter [Chitinophagaceae bacterium MMS25-I14]